MDNSKLFAIGCVVFMVAFALGLVVGRKTRKEINSPTNPKHKTISQDSESSPGSSPSPDV